MMQGTKKTVSLEEEDFGNVPLESNFDSSGVMFVEVNDELVVDVQESKVYMQELGGRRCRRDIKIMIPISL
jgi:hypothetical protein